VFVFSILTMKTLTFLLFLVSIQTFGQITLIPAGSSWKYLDNGSNQGTNWTDPSFNDASWASGNAELGYGDGDEATVVSYGNSATNKHITTYFRKTFNISNTYSSYTLRVKRDDGIVVYINGTQVFRDNLNASFDYQTLANTNASDDGASWIESTIGSGALQAGNNVIAVEIHQVTAASTDISFDLQLLGNLSNIVSRGPYLQMGTSTAMQVRWRTPTASNSEVKIGTTYGDWTNIFRENTSTTEHIVNLSGLNPNTKYYYTIGSTTEVIQSLSDNYFYTAPTVGTEQKIRVWATGDCGTGNAAQIAVKNRFQNYVGNNYINLWLLLGDNAYAYGNDTEYQNNFFQPYQNDRIMKQTLLMPALGNHDYYSGTGFQNDPSLAYFLNFSLPTNAQIGGIASNTEAYYSYNYGNVHFVSIDSFGREGTGGYILPDTLQNQQIAWLKNDLATNTQKWTILYWHHPPYTMGSHNSDSETDLKAIREKVIPILERYKVDLVLCGHSHNYERSFLMKGHFGLEATFNNSHKKSTSSGKYDGSIDSCPYIFKSNQAGQGIVFVVAGSAGWGGGGTQANYPHNAMYFSHSTNGGSIYLEIEANRLDLKWIADDGAIKDQFTMMKDVSKKVSLIANPNQNTINLNASWVGTYNWTTGGQTTQRITLNNPIIGASYYVQDSQGCLRDTVQILSDVACASSRNIVLNMAAGSVAKYESSGQITASNIISTPADVKYDAARSILLTPGFQVKNCGKFSAYIDGCANLKQANTPPD
jgi:acid phosphatase type 7